MDGSWLGDVCRDRDRDPVAGHNMSRERRPVARGGERLGDKIRGRLTRRARGTEAFREDRALGEIDREGVVGEAEGNDRHD